MSRQRHTRSLPRRQPFLAAVETVHGDVHVKGNAESAIAERDGSQLPGMAAEVHVPFMRDIPNAMQGIACSDDCGFLEADESKRGKEGNCPQLSLGCFYLAEVGDEREIE